MRGTVKWFNRSKGFGFITGEDGKDYFVHYSEIDGEGFKNLDEDEEVTFKAGEGREGRVQACHVTKVA
ncbi:MAG: cold shock domain-containing protein [Clostridiales bacterium]|nr:cold shock domain-containing protein [Clostridiales bacterium]